MGGDYMKRNPRRTRRSGVRKWRDMAHKAFDPLWKSGQMTRPEAYVWLSQQMGIPWKMTHIGWFDMEHCQRVIKLAKAAMKKMEESV
jgi:hypothetical protein